MNAALSRKHLILTDIVDAAKSVVVDEKI